MRIVITGARGHLGSATVNYCREQQADVLAVDITGQPGANEFTRFLKADLTDAAQAYDVLDGADAAIHLAAIPSQRIHPSRRTFFTNVSMTWNVLEAAARLKVGRVVLASSLQVNHTVTPRTPIRYRYLPLDEQHPVSPQDDYGLSKLVGETCANTFAEHWGLTVVSFRFPLIASQQAFDAMPVPDPNTPYAALFAYVHLRDAARACYLAATADLPPNTHHVLFAAARDSYLAMPTQEYARQFFPDAELRSGLDEYGSLLDCSRAQHLIAFTPEYSLKR
jgi:nucleoside-diphosphate-sugar epimerase